MATITREPCRVHYTISGNSPEVREVLQGSLTTFKVGSVLMLTASGRVRRNAGVGQLSGANFAHGALYQGVAGLAMQDSSSETGTSTTKVKIAVANPDSVFIANVVGRTAAVSVTAQAMIGSVGSCSYAGTRFYVQRNGTAATCSTLHIRDVLDTVGDTYGRVSFQFMRAYMAYRK
jgi:hypothetical protein